MKKSRVLRVGKQVPPTVEDVLSFRATSMPQTTGFDLMFHDTSVEVEDFKVSQICTLQGSFATSLMPGERLSSFEETLTATAAIFTSACENGLTWERSTSDYADHQFDGLARGYAVAKIRLRRQKRYGRKYDIEIRLFNEELFKTGHIPRWGFEERHVDESGSADDIFTFGAELIDEYLNDLWEHYMSP